MPSTVMELPIQYEHEPVLLDKVLEQLCVRETGVYMDCTYGRGGPLERRWRTGTPRPRDTETIGYERSALSYRS